MTGALKAAMDKPTNGKIAHPGDSIQLITAEQLRSCAGTMSPQRALIMSNLINQLFPYYGIKTKDVLHEPLANFLQESGEFGFRVENMYYKSSTLVAVWPKHFHSLPEAEPYAKNPKALANFIYGEKLAKVLGNRPGTDDGWNLRGSGFVGLTGRYVLEAFAQYKRMATAEEAAEYARNSDYGALDSALWFFCVLKKLMDESEKDDFIGIVKEINGGTIGLKDRQHYYALVKKYVI